KRLMGMYVTREDEIDRILRAGVLVDLHQAFKQGVRASVEEYSLKKIEAFYGFERKTPLDVSREAMRYVEHRLELGWGDEELQDWHRREDKATFWEGYRLAELDDLDLLEEKAGLAGLKLLERLVVERKIPVDRYAFAKQETEARVEQDLYYQGEKFGSVSSIDPVEHTIDIKKTRKTAELHPTAVCVWERPLKVKEQTEA